MSKSPVFKHDFSSYNMHLTKVHNVLAYFYYTSLLLAIQASISQSERLHLPMSCFVYAVVLNPTRAETVQTWHLHLTSTWSIPHSTKLNLPRPRRDRIVVPIHQDFWSARFQCTHHSSHGRLLSGATASAKWVKFYRREFTRHSCIMPKKCLLSGFMAQTEM